MLVLTRKLNQSIVIGETVEIVVLEIRGEQVRIGIKAPRDVTVHRQEVYEAIKSQNVEAAGVNPDDVPE
ncbi:MAG: carbon storage regulator CsrA [Fimbriimonadaceae bacterium]|nr:carbon storage regulator CsrA [Fimbriimonadaceae bacterium]